MSSTFKHLPLLAACFLGSCMVGPDFRTPTNDLPATWEANRPPHSSDKDLRSWWNIFGDPQLNRLVSTSLNNNPDMKVALLRIREAREKLRVSQASLLPSADASAGWSLSPDRGFRSSTSQNFSLGCVHLLGAGPLWRQPAVHRSLPRLPHVHRSFRRGRAHSPAGGRRHGLL